MQRRHPLAAASLLFAALAAHSSARPEFHGMGNLPLESGSAPLTTITGVNDMGVVVGNVYQGVVAEQHAARWSAPMGYHRLNTLALDGDARATGITATAGVVSVDKIVDIYSVVHYWSNHQFISTGVIGTGHGITVDGAKFVVTATGGPGTWSFSFGFEPFLLPPGTQSANVTDFSDDGSVALGTVYPPNGDSNAIIWSGGSSYLDLHSLLGVINYEITAISGDGSTVVGFVFDLETDIAYPFRWTLAGGLQPLPLPPDAGPADPAGAYDVSFDGSVIVGTSVSMPPSRPAGPGRTTSRQLLSLDPTTRAQGFEYEPFIWTASAGSRRVQDILADGGVTIPFGWNLEVATKVSSNGRYVVGQGLHEIPSVRSQPETWFVDLEPAPPPVPCEGDADLNGDVNFADITKVLERFNTTCP